MSRPARVAALLAALALLLAIAGCGHRGPVRPLLKPLPSAPKALSLVQQGGQFLLSWAIPTTNQDGTPLTDLQGFAVYKMQYDPTRDCPECRDTSVLWQHIDLDYLRQTQRIGDRLYVRDADLNLGKGYQYRVVPLTKDDNEGAQAQIRQAFVRAPAPPASLSAEPHDQMVSLHWTAVTVLPPTAVLAGYNIYRRDGLAPFPPSPVNLAPVADIAFRDFGLSNGRSYTYAVRSVVRLGGVAVESSLSAPAEVTPQSGK
jgi:hypothetical protein